MSFDRVAVFFVAALCVSQQLVIGLTTSALAFYPLVREATPWYAPIVKTVAAIAIVSFSFYVCRNAVRSITASWPSHTRKGLLALANLGMGLAFTPAGLFLLVFGLMFSHGDQPHPPPYWVPVSIGGGALLVFAIICWLWMVTLMLSHEQLNQGEEGKAFLIALSPLIALMAVGLFWPPIFRVAAFPFLRVLRLT